MLHTIYIDLVEEAARAGTALTQLPSVRMKHLSDETLSFAFMTGGEIAAVADWESGRVIVRKTSRSDVLLLDTELAVAGSGTSTRYAAAWAAAGMDSPALREQMGDTTEDVPVWCEVMWIAAGKTLRVAFEITIAPAFNVPEEDDPPDPTEPASEAWGDARFPRIDKALALTDGQRAQVLENIGDLFRFKLAVDEDYLHVYTPAGAYKGSLVLMDLEQPDL